MTQISMPDCSAFDCKEVSLFAVKGTKWHSTGNRAFQPMRMLNSGGVSSKLKIAQQPCLK